MPYYQPAKHLQGGWNNSLFDLPDTEDFLSKYLIGPVIGAMLML